MASAPLHGDAGQGGLLAAVRSSCADVVTRARHVRIDEVRLGLLAERLATEQVPTPRYDEVHHHRGDAESTLAFVLTLDAVNFGSGWFPHLRKRAGMSGYFTVATHLKRRFDDLGAFSAAELAEIDAERCAVLFGQDPGHPELGALFALFARAWNELGRTLGERYAGRFAGPVEEAAGSADRLTALLARLPCYRDVARHGDRDVWFLKRAQISVADLALAFDGNGPGAFADLDALTCFADNLVPHVLRLAGVLQLAPGLLSRIERGVLLPSGAPEEVELRAGAVVAVERLVAQLAGRGVSTSAREIDHLLWQRGQRPEIKAHPRHRTRSPYY